MRSAGAATPAAGEPPQPAGGTAGRLLRAPFTRRTWVEGLYALVGVVLGAVGFICVAAALYAGALLAVTFVGLPLIAAALRGARRIVGLHRDLARRLLGVEVGTPAPLRPKPGSGFLGWVWSGLRDTAGWRAVLYLLVKFPVALVTFVVAAAFWLYGAFFVCYPVLRLVLPRERDSHGVSHRGLQLFSDGFLDTWPRILAVVAVGVVLLLAAPWVVRGALALERLLVRGLLGPTKLSERVRGLEETRAHAVDDAAAALRRIERDLHVGVPERPSPSIETIAYFCTAELLTNVAKHSRARHATVELTQQPAGRLRLRVRDDGAGGARISGEGAGGGLAGLADRLRTVDGRLEISSPPGGPTVVTVELPSRA